MDLEYSSLNWAHQHARKAIAYVRKRKYDDAILSHTLAQDFLESAMNRVTNPRSIQSLSCQREFHKNQTKIVKVRKEQYRYLKKVMEMEKFAAKLASNGGEHEENIKLKLSKMLDDAEQLLRELASNQKDPDSVSLENNAIHALEALNNPQTPPPKDDLMIIQELQDLISNVHGLVVEIAHQLEESLDREEVLKEKVKKLQAKGKNRSQSQEPSTSMARNESLSIEPPLSYVPRPQTSRPRSPCKHENLTHQHIQHQFALPHTKVPPVATGTHTHPRNICQLPNFTELEIPERPPLPPLPPLEMPDLDYSMFTTSLSLLPPPKKSATKSQKEVVDRDGSKVEVNVQNRDKPDENVEKHSNDEKNIKDTVSSDESNKKNDNNQN